MVTTSNHARARICNLSEYQLTELHGVATELREFASNCDELLGRLCAPATERHGRDNVYPINSRWNQEIAFCSARLLNLAQQIDRHIQAEAVPS